MWGCDRRRDRDVRGRGEEITAADGNLLHPGRGKPSLEDLWLTSKDLRCRGKTELTVFPAFAAGPEALAESFDPEVHLLDMARSSPSSD